MTPTPFISVIMPIRNEAQYIELSLGAVLAQDYPHEQIEVLCADGMSDDNTREIIRHMAQQADIPVQIVDNPEHIVPYAMNYAMEHAQGEIVVRVDGHCEIAPNYISKCVQLLYETKDDNVAGVGGIIETISQNEVGEAIAVAMSSRFGVGGSPFRTVQKEAKYVDTIPFPAYWKHIMDEAGPHDIEMMRTQDAEYNYRLRSMGYKLLLSPEVRSKYYSRGSLRKLARQYYQYGIYRVRLMQKHPAQMRPRQFVPFVFISLLLVSAILALVFPLAWVLPVALLFLYVAANLTASVITASQNGWQYLRLLPSIYTVLHFSYGFSFFVGFVRWRGKPTILQLTGPK